MVKFRNNNNIICGTPHHNLVHFICFDLQSCVHVVLDFVSPENVTECIHLIDEVRLLPEDHKAKVDKLEVYFIRILISNISSRIDQ